MTYTTGEIAAKCGVTVRTVQFYDQKELLCPSDFSEGGRRLYTDDDVSRLKLICILKSTGLSIDVIKEILSANNAKKILSVYLGEQMKSLQNEKKKLSNMEANIESISEYISFNDSPKFESSSGMESYIKGKKRLRKLYGIIIPLGIVADVFEIAGIAIWIKTGNWIPAVSCLAVWILLASFGTAIFARNVLYICPECNTVFRPRFREMFFANHKLKARKLKCPNCGEKSWCIETSDGEIDS